MISLRPDPVKETLFATGSRESSFSSSPGEVGGEVIPL